ncbi:NUDIX domain-containing protein [Streptosporangium sp. V21-05]|uniref:NUDIX domain-containing protein n=1 Tax=Streptosporangium sp. V21-05 TaxID=3446115 RepID=UPI003F536840
MAGRGWVSPEIWYASLSTAYAATGGWITNAAGQILLVKPHYRPFWLFPGGALDAGEFPHEGCAREIREELGANLKVGSLLLVDWVPARDDRPRPLMYFMFDCGVLSEDRIRLQRDELDEYRFVSVEDGLTMVDRAAAPRLTAALRARRTGRTEYLPAPLLDDDAVS